MAGKPTYHRVLWPTDFSPRARAALPYAVDLAARHTGELVLLHVLTPISAYVTSEIAGSVLIGVQQRVRTDADARLRRLAEQIRRAHHRVRVVLVEGVPADRIVSVAKRLRCDLIVIATHGRTALAHMLMGSVAENVVRHAPCPVLTVRPPRFKGESGPEGGRPLRQPAGDSSRPRRPRVGA